MEEIIRQLFIDAKNEYDQTQRLSDGFLKKLWTVFHAPLLGALDLVDRRQITRAISQSGRTLYRVTSNSGRTYTCFEVGDYCTCPAFTYSVLRKGEYIMCKHVLASRLAEAMNFCQNASWTDHQMTAAIETL